MIAKGTTHNNGARLADYLTTGKDKERAELWELRGFAATNIKDAFRDVQIMAGATKCEQPFFHVQVRNPDGETLTRQQWELAADRIERMLGLTGQPRAIAFHTNEQNGHEHMHIAWSRIDQDKFIAKELPFFKERLKKISRELELHFGLTVVTNRRDSPIKFAPTRAEHEQARRLGLDVHEVRDTIRKCWDRSDCGISFQAALHLEGLTLAQGERRDFVVIDEAGGLHALGKRILGVTAAETRERLSDIARENLPTVEQARTYLAGNQRDAIKQELAEVDRLLYGPSRDDLKRELAEVDKLLEAAKRTRQQEQPAPVWDRDRADSAWQVAVVNAAIEKEKIARQFVEPKARDTGSKERQAETGGKETERPLTQPTPQPIQTPARHLKEVAKESARDHEQQQRAANTKPPARTIFKRPVAVGKAATRTLGKTLDVVGSAVESLFAPKLTPEQIREGERATHRREAEAESAIDFSRYTNELTQQRRQQENEREAERRQQRERDGAGRER